MEAMVFLSWRWLAGGDGCDPSHFFSLKISICFVCGFGLSVVFRVGLVLGFGFFDIQFGAFLC